MKAAVLEELNKIVVKEVATPEVDDESLLVRVKTCAVCGSDIRIYRHGNSRVDPPQIIGHEIAGEVVKVGSKVSGFKVGDRVAIGADVPCGECSFCKDGIGNNCQINYAMGYQFAGGFAEYVLINRTVLNYGPIHKIPDNLSYNEAALAEPLACCINGMERAQIQFGDTVTIIGAGPIGCMLIVVARAMGATKVMVADMVQDRLTEAKDFGADVIINSRDEDFVTRVKEETEGLGSDVILTACPSGEAQMQALEAINNRGRINFFGGLPKGNSIIQLDSNIVHYKECMIVGSHGSVPRQHRLALKLIASGMIDMKRFISHSFGLDQIHEAFDIVEQKKGMKIVVNP
jgi:L-iditol 2-dehydrogenase